MPIDVVSLAQELVRIPSVNPMGRDLDGPIYFEAKLTDFLEQRLGELGLPCERHTVAARRDNLVTRVEGRGALRDRLILLEVHQDTVPVDGMSIPPFDAELHSGKIWGRGACDVKGGMAAVLSAMVQLSESPAANQPTVVMAMTVNEENGFDGAKDLCETWQTGRSELLPRAPDVAIVTEPTELDVIVAHKGTVRWRIHALGKAAHSSNPAAGDNAIFRMAKLISCLSDYAASQLPDRSDLTGAPTISVGTIQGGISVNTIPDRCTIEIDRRLLPGESPTNAVQHVLSYLESQGVVEQIVHDPVYLTAQALDASENSALATAVSAASQKHGGAGKLVGVPFGTDAGPISAMGVPTVVFGPGSIEQAHTKDEWIDASELDRAAKILVEFCQNLTATTLGN